VDRLFDRLGELLRALATQITQRLNASFRRIQEAIRRSAAD
jgi:hypothetical protein